MKKAAFLGTLLVLLGLWACNKPVAPSGTVEAADDFSLVVSTWSGDSVRFQIVETGGRNPLTAEPVLYEIYKLFTADSSSNLVARIFGGGAGYAAGETVRYTDERGYVIALGYRATLDTTLKTGSENRNEFRFVARRRTQLVESGHGLLSAGYLGRVVEDPQLRGGSILSFFEINGNDPYTATPWVRVAARVNLAGLTSLTYIRYSKILPVTFSQILAMDSLLKRAGRLDTHSVPIGSGYRFRFGDSSVINATGVPIGRFGGLVRIPVPQLSSFFDSVHHLTPAEARGDSDWYYLSRKDTLLSGAGSKWIYLHDASWGLPYTDSIGIQPWNMEIGLDLMRGGNRLLFDNAGKSVCVASDDIPFEIKTFGDTTFENEVSVWIATRNIYPTFMINGRFSNGVINNAVGMMEQVEWPDAILETRPADYRLSQGYLSATYQPDYENGYRVSPLAHLFLQNNNISIGKEYVESISLILRRNPRYLASQMARGSILGYSETHLNDFNYQDSIFADTLDRMPATGWFTIRPLSDISDSGYFRGGAKLYSLAGVQSNADLIPIAPDGMPLPGRKYFSIFSGFFPGPDDDVSTAFGQLKLFKNPMRSVPYFIIRNMSGRKEFVLCTYGRGKYFKEPRAHISSLASDRIAVWDKIAPHVKWDTTANTQSAVYAPMYSRYEGGKRSKLELTPVPYVFNVTFTLIDAGFGRLTRARLLFNYSDDLLSVNPVTGERAYRNPSFAFEVNPEILARYGSTAPVTLQDIDARLWQNGFWDMWVETEDDLQNKGLAPVFPASGSYDPKSGSMSVRQIQIMR